MVIAVNRHFDFRAVFAAVLAVCFLFSFSACENTAPPSENRDTAEVITAPILTDTPSDDRRKTDLQNVTAYKMQPPDTFAALNHKGIYMMDGNAVFPGNLADRNPA